MILALHSKTKSTYSVMFATWTPTLIGCSTAASGVRISTSIKECLRSADMTTPPCQLTLCTTILFTYVTPQLWRCYQQRQGKRPHQEVPAQR
jgi:hypothetical protein